MNNPTPKPRIVVAPVFCPPSQCDCGQPKRRLCTVYYEEGSRVVWEGTCPRSKSKQLLQIEFK